MGIVLLIIAAIVSGGLMVFTSSLDKQKDAETRGKMAVIQKALLDYRRAYNRLPCPAYVSAAINEAAYGTESGAAGSCSAPSNGNSDLTGAGIFINGMVPTKTLRLPDDMGIDGWGRRIAYVIDARMTGNTPDPLPFETIDVSDDVTNATTRLTVKDSTAADITDKAVYVLISFGANGNGAYPRSGGLAPIDVTSNNPNEFENIDAVDTIFVQGAATTTDATDRTKTFDDIVVYATRAQLFSVTE